MMKANLIGARRNKTIIVGYTSENVAWIYTYLGSIIKDNEA